MSPAVWEALSTILRERHQQIKHVQSVAGGSINSSFKIITSSGRFYFCKTNAADTLPRMFEKEKNGIEAIAGTATIAVPGNVFTGVTGDEQWILMEWIEKRQATGGFWKNFGAALAAMHDHTAPSFGFGEDNYMGALPQLNAFHDHWVSFFREQRLLPQVKLARDRNLLTSNEAKHFERLYQRLPILFNEEKPSLVHGDLWSGNFLCGADERAVLVDPAVYYGNRQVDLAMTTLFGGFEDAFYNAYHYHYPLPAGYKEQWKVLNLYPLLIHLNLFGKSYRSSILGTIAAY